MEEKKISPVLLGADLNAYNVARAFHERYGVISYAFGKYSVGATSNSKIINFTAVDDLSEKDIFLKTLINFSKAHSTEELYLFACTDEYAELMIEFKDILSPLYFFSCPEKALAERLISKESFYRICDEHALPYPRTFVFTKKMAGSDINENMLGFSFPIIIKPSSSIEYWRNPFDGMKKVYTAYSSSDASQITEKIFASGYEDSIILQERIPGGEDAMYVLTAYSGKDKKVKSACLGHVLLGEHTPKGLGNHVAILTEFHEDIVEKITDFLDKIGYSGFSNFDIIRDSTSGKFYILEINLRQGRSNYYMSASGANIAELTVLDKKDSLKEKNIASTPFFWHTVPRNIIYKYIHDKPTKKRISSLVANGHSASSLFYPYDMKKNSLRHAYVLAHNLRYFAKYGKYK